MRAFHFVAGTLCLLAASCPRLMAQPWTLVPSSLSCTRSSLDLGFATLPACWETKISFLDRVVFWVSARYESPCGSESLPSITLIQNIGLNNGPCTKGVGWNLQGAVAGAGSTAYVYGIFSAQSIIAQATIRGSMDCNGVPFYDGDNGARLACE